MRENEKNICSTEDTDYSRGGETKNYFKKHLFNSSQRLGYQDIRIPGD